MPAGEEGLPENNAVRRQEETRLEGWGHWLHHQGWPGWDRRPSVETVLGRPNEPRNRLNKGWYKHVPFSTCSWHRG